MNNEEEQTADGVDVLLFDNYRKKRAQSVPYIGYVIIYFDIAILSRLLDITGIGVRHCDSLGAIFLTVTHNII